MWHVEHPCWNLALVCAGCSGLPRFSPPYFPPCFSPNHPPDLSSRSSSSACAMGIAMPIASRATASTRNVCLYLDMSLSLFLEGQQVGEHIALFLRRAFAAQHIVAVALEPFLHLFRVGEPLRVGRWCERVNDLPGLGMLAR